MQYRFKQHRRQFKPGDLVPATYDSGTIQTMLAAHIIEPVPDPVEVMQKIDEKIGELVDAIKAPEPADLKEDKAIHTSSKKVRRK